MPSSNKVSTEEEPDDEGEKMGSRGSMYEEIEGEEETEVKRGPIRRCLQKTWVRSLVFIGLTGYGAFCVIFDWLWVRDMIGVEKALVFGPADTATVIALMVVASIGTVAFGWEIVNNAKKVCKKDPIIDEDLAQVLVLFVEEIPQTILNVLLSSCREMPISAFQLAKASLGILGAALRVLFTLYHYFTPRKHGRRTGCIPWLLRTVILAACTFVFLGSLLVFVFTFTEPPTDGSDFGDLKIPDTVVDKSYDNGRYIYRSGVYFSHPSFAHCQGNNISWGVKSVNWIKLEGLYGIMDAGDEQGTRARFYYDSDFNYIQIETATQPEVCFRTELASCDISKLVDCNAIPAGLDEISLKFVHVDRTKTLVFGDVKMKAVFSNGGCAEMRLDEEGYLAVGNTPEAQVQYFQATPETNETFSYKPREDGTSLYSYYQVGGDLNYVTDVWLTGYRMCEMSGSVRPNWDKSLDPQC